MKRLRALLGRRRKPPAPVRVELSFSDGANEQFIEFLRKSIRPYGSRPGDGSAGVPR